MRMLALALIAVACCAEGGVAAQDKPDPRPVYTSEAMLQRIRQNSTAGRAALRCVLPDKTEHAVDATVTVRGRMYECVETFDQNLQPSGAVWTPVERPFNFRPTK